MRRQIISAMIGRRVARYAEAESLIEAVALLIRADIVARHFRGSLR